MAVRTASKQTKESIIPVNSSESKQDASTTAVSRPTPAPAPSWPPPPTPPVRRPLWKTIAIQGSIILSLLLLISGSVLIIFSTTRGYTHAITRVDNLEAQQTRNAVGTIQAHIRGTQQALTNAQNAIEASATAQAVATTQASDAAIAATATATANQDLLTLWTQGTPKFTDALTDDTGAGGWDQGGASSYVGCAFQDGSYQASENQLSYMQPCIAQNTNFADFAYQITLTSKKGNDGQAGLIFRVSNSNDAYYFLYISTDGSYGIDYYDASGTATEIVHGISDAINTGVEASNTLTLIANKDQFIFFANSQYLNSASDSTLSSGKIGVAVVDNDTPIDVAFSNAQLWQNKANK
jgi:hypothetical protein